MPHDTIFRISFGFFAVLFLAALGHAHRKAMREHGSRFAQAANEYPPLLWVRGLLGIVVYAGLFDWLLSAGWFPWATAPLPPWARWSGVGLAEIVAGLMWWTMIALGGSYHGTMGLHPNHKLVTHGPYRFVRHPMNAVFPLVAVALFLLSANLLVGVPGVVLLCTVSLVRTPVEERQLIERFGDEYRQYKRRTGRFFPIFRRRRGSP